MALFEFLKIGQKGIPLGFFRNKIYFVKSSIWGMIYIGNLILRTMVFEYFNNSPYFKSDIGIFLEKIAISIMGLTENRKNANFASLSSISRFNRAFKIPSKISSTRDKPSKKECQ